MALTKRNHRQCPCSFQCEDAGDAEGAEYAVLVADALLQFHLVIIADGSWLACKDISGNQSAKGPHMVGSHQGQGMGFMGFRIDLRAFEGLVEGHGEVFLSGKYPFKPAGQDLSTLISTPWDQKTVAIIAKAVHAPLREASPSDA